MKRETWAVTAGILLLVLATAAQVAYAANPPRDGWTVLERTAQALGGRPVLQQPPAYKADAVRDIQSPSDGHKHLEFKETSEPPRLRQDVVFSVPEKSPFQFKYTNISDGRRMWSDAPDSSGRQKMREVRPGAQGWFERMALPSLAIIREPLEMRDQFRLDLQADEKVGDQLCHRIKISSTIPGADFVGYVWVDRESSLPVRLEYWGLRVELRDWRRVGPMLAPFRYVEEQRSGSSGGYVAETRLTSLQVLDKPLGKEFFQPAGAP